MFLHYWYLYRTGSTAASPLGPHWTIQLTDRGAFSYFRGSSPVEPPANQMREQAPACLRPWVPFDLDGQSFPTSLTERHYRHRYLFPCWLRCHCCWFCDEANTGNWGISLVLVSPRGAGVLFLVGFVSPRGLLVPECFPRKNPIHVTLNAPEAHFYGGKPCNYPGRLLATLRYWETNIYAPGVDQHDIALGTVCHTLLSTARGTVWGTASFRPRSRRI